MAERNELVEKARIAEEAERYHDMVTIMKSLAEMPEELSIEERNMFSVAFKNVIESQRFAWRVIFSIEQKTEESKKNVVKEYRRKVKEELEQTCNIVLSLLDRILIAKTSNVESKVFYLMMCGDYNRYLSEISLGYIRTAVVEQSRKCYEKAVDLSKMSKMSPTNPIRLCLALSFSVFNYEILNNHDKAKQLAKEAFDDAMELVNTLDKESYMDTTLIMQLLRDKLSLWTSDTADTDKEEDDVKVGEEK